METNYGKLKVEIKQKIKDSAKKGSKPAITSSKTDLVNMAQTLMNSKDEEVVTYNMRATEDGAPITSIDKPVERYRNSLKPILKHMGIDKEEINKIDDYEFNKEQASAMMDLAGVVIKDYMSVGRKYKFPVTSKEETQMSIHCEMAKANKRNIKTFQDMGDGTVKPVDTGKVRTTKARMIVKASNAVPHWLVEDDDL